MNSTKSNDFNIMTSSYASSNKSNSNSSKKKKNNKKFGNLYKIMDLVADDDYEIDNTEIFVPSPRKQLPSFVNIINSSLQTTDKIKIKDECKKESKKYWLSSDSTVLYSNKIKNIDVTNESSFNLYTERKLAYDQYLLEEEERRERIIEIAKYEAERNLFALIRKNHEKDPIVEQKKAYLDKYHNVGNSTLRASVNYNTNYVGLYKKSVSAFIDDEDDNNNNDIDDIESIKTNDIKRFDKEIDDQIVRTPRNALLKEIVKKRMMPFVVKDLLPPIVYNPPKKKKSPPDATFEEVEYYNTIFTFLNINPAIDKSFAIDYKKIMKSPIKKNNNGKERICNSDDYIGKALDIKPGSPKIYKATDVVKRRSCELKSINALKILEKWDSNDDVIEEPVTHQFVDNTVTRIDLKNQGLGDDKASCLAAALSFCPNITSIDISGNRLTDVSVNPILNAMLNYMKCTSLNLSDNKLDELSIDVLKENLQDKECRLKELYLSKSDIDDNECVEFIFSIAENKSLLKLDLSNNLIGEMEDHHTVFPDFITGPEAISEVILMNDILLELDLSWNNIRKDSAMTLALAIGDCKSLEKINLANNNFGDVACQHLFYKLKHNTSLKKLDLSYNSIYPKGITVLANILDYNKTLDEVNVNGNSIGVEGGKSLLRSIREAAREKRFLHIHFRDGNMHYIEKDLFCRDKPGRLYELDLSLPYEWSIANSLLQIAMAKSTASFTSLAYKSPGSKSKWESIKLQRLNPANEVGFWQADVNNINECVDAIIKVSKPTNLMKNKASDAIKTMGGHMGLVLIDSVANRIRQGLLKVARNLRDKVYIMFRIIFRTVFQIVDRDGSGSVDEEELAKCLLLLGIKSLDDEDVDREKKARSIAKRMIGGVDVDRSGTLDEGEFERMLFVNYTETSPQHPPPLVDIKTSSPWSLPDYGRLRIDFFYDSLPPTSRDIQADESVKVFTKAMKKVLLTEEQKTTALSLSFASDLFLTCEQAELIIKNFRGHDERWFETVLRILPNLITTFETCKFLAQNLSFKEILMLRMKWGNYFRAITGIATGHYLLDLSMPYDRLAGKKLGELNNLDKNKIMSESQTRDTSQSSNWENFRNESLNGTYKPLTSVFFQEDHQVGNVAFDFVVTTRPVQGILPVSDDGIENMLATIFSAEDIFVDLKNSDSNTNTNTNTDTDNNCTTTDYMLSSDSDSSDTEEKPKTESTQIKEQSAPETKSSPPMMRRKAFINIAAAIEQRDPETIAKEKAELLLRKEKAKAARQIKKKITAQWQEVVSTNYNNYLKAYDRFLQKKVAESREELAQANTSNEPIEESPSYLRQLYNTKVFKEARKIPYYQINLLRVKKVNMPIVSYGDSGYHMLKPSELIASENDSIHSTPIGTPKMTPQSKSKSKKASKIMMEKEEALLIQKCITFEKYLLSLEVYMIYNMWLSCRQVMDIYNAFKAEDAPLDVLVRVICILFSRIVDLENFSDILTSIPSATKCEIIHRLGILNTLCPMKPDGLYELDLSCKDHREFLKLLIKLAVIEPGQNAFIEQFYSTRVEEPRIDLEIPPLWTEPDDKKVGSGTESGPPRFGYIFFKYTSDPAFGCEPNWDARKELTQFRTLAGTRGTFIRGFDFDISDLEKVQNSKRRASTDLQKLNLLFNDDDNDEFNIDTTITDFDTFVDDKEIKRKMSTFQKAADGRI